MARKPRFNLPGIPQHVIQRGNNRSACFFAECDYRVYLEHLREASDRTDCSVHAYVLMTNHVHLLVTPEREHALPDMMQALGRRYVRYINSAYRRTGTLWEGRYKASLVDSERYVLTCYRYIEMNPVRADMTRVPGEYRWSSHRANAFGQSDSVLSPHPVYRGLGSDAAARQAAYRACFGGALGETELHEVRDALNQELVLGCERFKREIEQKTARRASPGKAGRPRVNRKESVY